MTATQTTPTPADNQRALAAALARLKSLLERAATSTPPPPSSEHPRSQRPPKLPPSALDQLASRFRLSAFERDLLLLAAAPELDSAIGDLLARLQGDPQRRAPTFSLALAVLPDSHWSALSPDAPLRRWRLLEIGTGDSLVRSPIRVDERLLHFLCGVHATDDRLRPLFRPLKVLGSLPQSHRDIAERSAAQLRTASSPAVIQFVAPSTADGRVVAAAVAGALGAPLYLLNAHDLPEPAAEREALARLWEREVALSGALAAVECSDSETEHRRAVAWLDQLQTSAILLAREPITLRHLSLIRHDLPQPPHSEIQQLWTGALGDLARHLNGQLPGLAREFRLGPDAIQLIATQLQVEFPSNPPGPTAKSRRAPRRPELAPELAGRLRSLCRAQARAPLESLAQRLQPVASWDDLVLPTEARDRLREIALHARQRHRVNEDWGFARHNSRGLGLAALFSGPSGTGKTMAAEVLARELDLELFRIDLSAVVSKYIGETEKNLRRVFDAAESGVAILLFDEADALFGKRTEVKDSHDRYANIEVSYLLQRMEDYRGIAILTTNLRASLDDAFLRRLRFIVQFPFPDAAQRAEIWRRVFPTQTPTDHLDHRRLAQLHVSGGHIRNIALGAAVLAADSDEPVRMKHLHAAARTECAKLERAPGEAEFAGWL